MINDAYNANPTSMRAALESLAALPRRRRVAILGEMAELDDPEAAHAEVAALADRLGIELIAVGTDLYGVAPVDDPVAALGPLSARDAVLVKASRVGGLERFAAELLGEEARRLTAGARSAHQARNAANAAPNSNTQRAPIASITGPNDQVADRHRAAERHEPQRHHRRPLGVGEVLLEDRAERTSPSGST